MVWEVGSASIKYGNFITTIVDFLIIAFSIFLVVRYFNKLNKLKEFGDLESLANKLETKLDKKGRFKKRKAKKEEEKKEEQVEEVPAKPETKICPYCYTDIKFEATRCPHCTSVLEEVKE